MSENKPPPPVASKPSEIAARRMREIREAKRWSQQDVADRLDEIGSPTDRATVARTEGAARGLSLDDAMMMAAALDVSPLSLSLPEDGDDLVAVGPRLMYGADYVRRWICGLAPLPLFLADFRPAGVEEEKRNLISPDGKEWNERAADERNRFFELFLPLSRWRAWQRPGVRHLVQMADAFADAAGEANASEMRRCLSQLAAEIERQRAQLEGED